MNFIPQNKNIKAFVHTFTSGVRYVSQVALNRTGFDMFHMKIHCAATAPPKRNSGDVCFYVIAN